MGFEVEMKNSTFLYMVGNGDFLGSFFDTVTYRLEKGIRGKQFPVFNKLYQGESITFGDLCKLEKEVEKITKKLKKFSPKEVVWNMEDLSQQPPWGDNISSEITDLSNYFVTSNGKQLFDVLNAAIKHAAELKTSIKVKSTFE